MDYAHYTEFENFALIPISRHLRQTFDDSYADYNNVLSSKYRKAIQEIRENKLKYQPDISTLNIYLSDLFKKISDLKKSLFIESDFQIIYLLEDIEVDKSLSPAMKCIITLLDKVNGLLESTRKDIFQYTETRTAKTVVPDNPVVEIHGDRYGFNVLNQRILLTVWKSLKKNGFIANNLNSYDPFERNFTGGKITKRIKWLPSINSLHYFIDGISGENKELGIGIKEEQERWIMASSVFEKKDGSLFNSDLLSHANRKPPIEQQRILNEIISLFNKQPIKKD